jgi:hypothetical protein
MKSIHSSERSSKSRAVIQRQSPHPATVIQAKAPHPATVNRAQTLHPAVAQRQRAVASSVVRTPGAGAVAQQARARIDMSWLGSSGTIEIKEGKKTVKYKGSYVAKSGGTPAYFDFQHGVTWPISININKSVKATGGWLTVTLDSGKSLSLRPYPDNVVSDYQFINRNGSNFLRLTFHPED